MTEKDWKDFLEFQQIRPLRKEEIPPFPPNMKIIMTGGYLSNPEKDPSKRYFKDAAEYLEDPRKTGLKNGLRQLTIEQLQRVIDYPGEMVLDSFNYEDGKFCPLAVALELDKTMIDPTHNKVFQVLTDMDYKVYNTRGIVGKFYTDNRKEDLLTAVQEILQEKTQIHADLGK
jgi:hypothetical protein